MSQIPPTASRKPASPAVPAGAVTPLAAALGEALAVCAFDWRQSLPARLIRARKFATPAYADALVPTTTDETAWLQTQQDRESGSCSDDSVAVLREAPNTSSVQYVRVAMTQRVSARGVPARTQPFAAQYRVERRVDGGWLVGAESDGG